MEQTMHWTTILLNKYKEALVAFDTSEREGKEFLVKENLEETICKWLNYLPIHRKHLGFVSAYVKRNIKSSMLLAPRPHKWGVWLPIKDILDSIKIRMQHLYRMREELNITEPLLTLV